MRADHVFSHVREMQRGKDGDHKERRVLLMSMTISRKLAGVKETQGPLHEPLILQEFTYQHPEATEKEI